MSSEFIRNKEATHSLPIASFIKDFRLYDSTKNASGRRLFIDAIRAKALCLTKKLKSLRGYAFEIETPKKIEGAKWKGMYRYIFDEDWDGKLIHPTVEVSGLA